MANITINGLPTRGTVLDTTVFPTQTGGVTEKVTGEAIRNYISTIPEIISPGNIHAQGNVTAGINIIAPVMGSNATVLYGSIQTPIQTGITQIGTLNNLDVVGNLTLNGGAVVSEGAATTFAAINNTPIGNSVPSTGVFTTLSSNEFSTVGNVSGLNGIFSSVTSTTIRSLGSILPGSNVSVDAGSAALWFRNSFIRTGSFQQVTANTTNSVTTTANTVVANTFVVNTAIRPNANVAVDVGTATSWFRTVYGVSVQAQYADLAEKYTADSDYPPGTVLVFGGDEELTQSTVDHDPSVAGVVSTNPAYLMNSAATGSMVELALVGRVPCLVKGPVKRGERLVSGHNGSAVVLDVSKYTPGCGLGYAIESIPDDSVKLIEIAVMKF